MRTARLLVCAAAVAACGNVTAGGVGQVETYMSGNDSASSPSAVGRAGTEGPAAAPLAALSFEGDVTATASLELLSVLGQAIDLTPLGPVTATADLEGTQEPRIAEEVVPAGGYESVRIVFTQVSAEVSAGLEIGGLPFTELITVDLSGGSLEVIRTVDLDVPDGGVAAFVVDLNADAWIPLADASTRTVDPADFAAAVRVSPR
jgi:hypothetical protein